MKKCTKYLGLMLVAMLLCSGCGSKENNFDTNKIENISKTDSDALDSSKKGESISLNEIPPYTEQPYVTINNNIPYFDDSELNSESFETYSDLDSLGRCGVAYANVGQDIMPTKKRGDIGQVKPTGWHTVKYDNVDGKYLYNRCHLIGYQLTAENANEKNLITGTRYMNVDGMLPFENMVADYVKETNNHVLYRVTPIYEENNLVANGVMMEAKSVEDQGEGVLFNVFVYNVQPGIQIDYATGESTLAGTGETAPVEESAKETEISTPSDVQTSVQVEYILNSSTKKFHKPSCSSISSINESNKETYNGSREELISQGYEACGRCHP